MDWNNVKDGTEQLRNKRNNKPRLVFDLKQTKLNINSKIKSVDKQYQNGLRRAK